MLRRDVAAKALFLTLNQVVMLAALCTGAATGVL